MNSDTLFPIDPSTAPPLEVARRKLDVLIAKREAIATEWRESGQYARYQDWPAEWYATYFEIEATEREILRLELAGVRG